MKKIKQLLCFLLIITSLANGGIVNAKGSLSLDQDNKSIKSKLAETKDKLKDKESQMSNVEEEINRLDADIKKAVNEISRVKSEISKIEKDIQDKTEEMKEAEKNIDGKMDTLNARLRVMYKTGTVSYLQVILGAENFTDFLSRLDLVQRIAKQDVDLLEYMQQQKQIIVDKKEELERQKQLLEHQQTQAKLQQEKLQLANRSKQKEMDKLKKDHSKLEKLEDELNADAKKLTKEVQRLQNPTKKHIEGAYTWPIPGKYRITSPFGYRIHPIFGTKKLHTGIDISYNGQYGTPVVAAKSGTVIFAGWKGGYGNAVMIDHGGQIVTMYAHNQSLLVSVGQEVKTGQQIAKGGSTGNSTGPHSHFEVRKNGQYVNPLNYVNK